MGGGRGLTCGMRQRQFVCDGLLICASSAVLGIHGMRLHTCRCFTTYIYFFLSIYPAIQLSLSLSLCIYIRTRTDRLADTRTHAPLDVCAYVCYVSKSHSGIWLRMGQQSGTHRAREGRPHPVQRSLHRNIERTIRGNLPCFV